MKLGLQGSLSLLLLLLSCLPLHSAFAVPGFFKSDDQTIPIAVQRATKAVYRGLVLFGEPQLKLKPAKYDEAIALLEAQKIDSTEPFDKFIPKIQADLVRRCKAQKLKHCESGFPHTDGGTFFVAGDSRTLVTARHVIEDAVDGVNQVRLCEMKQDGVRLRLVLLDHDGKIVFDTVNGKDRALLRQSGNETLVSSSAVVPGLQALGSEYGATADETMNDFAIVKTNFDVSSEPLAWATDGARAQGGYFALGFPSQTFNREALGAENSDGVSFYITRGNEATVVPTSTDDKGTPIQHPEAAIKAFLQANSDNLLTLDSDLNHGMSGGPVVDSDGRVHAVAVIGFKKTDRLDLDQAMPECVWTIRPLAINGINGLLADFLSEACE